MATSQISHAERDQLIADEFGVNADYVNELLSQFERDPSSVGEEWRYVFDELLRNGRFATEAETFEPIAEPVTAEHTGPTSSRVAPGVMHATYEWGREATAPASEPVSYTHLTLPTIYSV